MLINKNKKWTAVDASDTLSELKDQRSVWNIINSDKNLDEYVYTEKQPFFFKNQEYRFEISVFRKEQMKSKPNNKINFKTLDFLRDF